MAVAEEFYFKGAWTSYIQLRTIGILIGKNGVKYFTVKLEFFFMFVCKKPVLLQDKNDMYASLYTIKWFMQCFLDRVCEVFDFILHY